MQYAQTVVKAVSKTLPFPISLSDKEGYIIGSTDPDRIGILHEPSREVLEKDNYLLFDEEKVKSLPNVLPGVAMPLKFDSTLVGVLGIIGPPEQVKPYAQLVRQYVEMMWHETFYKQLEELETKTLETFAQYILLNETVSQVKTEQYCNMLNIPYEAKRFCIVINIGDSLFSSIQNKIPVNQLKERLLNCTKKAFEGYQDILCTFLNTEKIILLKSVQSEADYLKVLGRFTDQSKELIKMFHVYQIKNISVAAGNLCDSIDRANESYHEAEHLIKLGEQLEMTPKIYTYHSWDMLNKLLPNQINEVFRKKVTFRLRPFIEEHHFPELKRNFITYCENNMNISETAKKLFIHRNTLIYRLKKIESLTSLDTGSFEHCMNLYLVLKSLKFED